jgi:hypothetical protein
MIIVSEWSHAPGPAAIRVSTGRAQPGVPVRPACATRYGVGVAPNGVSMAGLLASLASPAAQVSRAWPGQRQPGTGSM